MNLKKISEVAKFLNCTQWTVYQKIYKGEIKPIYINGPNAKKPTIRIDIDKLFN